MPRKLLTARILVILLHLFTASYSQHTDSRASELYDSAKHFKNTGKYSKAIETLYKALALKEKTKLDEAPEYYKIYNRLGIIYREQGNWNTAIEYYKKALHHTSDEYITSAINDNIATIYALKGDYQKAIDCYENTLGILQKSSNNKKETSVVNNYHNQGYAYNNLGNYALAIEKFKMSIKIAKENGIHTMGDTYFNCGLAYLNMDSMASAKYYYTKAVEINKQEYGERHIQTIRSNLYLADFYAQTSEYHEAMKLLKQFYNDLIATVGIKHPYTADYYKFLGDTHFSKGEYKLALTCFQKSMISRIPDFNDSCIYANPLTGVIPDRKLFTVLKQKARTFASLSEIEDQEHHLKAALNTFELAVDMIEKIRQDYFYENSKLKLAERENDTYMDIISICYTLMDITGNHQYADIAFKYFERGKYAILKESIDEERARHIASIPDRILSEEQKIKEQLGVIKFQIEDASENAFPDTISIAKLKNKHFNLMNQLESIIKNLEKNYPTYYKRKYKNHFVGISELQSVLLDKEVYISYEFTESKLYTFIVTPHQFEFTFAPIDSVFHKSLKFYSEFLHSEYLLSYASYRKAAYELYRVLIEPISAHLNGKNLLIAPNSQLSQIAFESLVSEPYQEEAYPDYRNVPYLIKKYSIGYAQSATLYVNSIKRNKADNSKFLGFAPDYKNYRDSLNYLPELSTSLKKISRLFRGKIFVKEEATEQAFKNNVGNFGIIHLYNYGYGDTINPSLSKMFFSYKKDTVDDGYLHSYEVDGLNINSDLIVLASCFSGSGAISKGEGTLSMGRSFMASGNPSIIMSLWAAYVEPTLFEMNVFYKYLLLGKRKDDALRLAKLKYLEETDNPTFTHPKFWTSLVVVGNQQPLFKGFVWKVGLIALGVISMLIFLSVYMVRKLNKRK